MITVSRPNFSRPVITRIAKGLALVALLAGLGMLARNIVADETAQARTLVDQGKQALAENERGKAVLSFERARLFAPRADFVRDAIDSAGVQEPEALPLRAVRYVTPREWSAFATTFGWIAGLGLAAIIARRRSGTLGHVTVGGAFAFALGMGALAASSSSTRSVVTADNTAAVVAPYQGASVVGPLAPGSVVILGPKQAPFARVHGGDGLEGWVPLKNLESIAQPAS